MNLKGLFWEHPPRYCGNCHTLRAVKGGLEVQKGADRQVWWCKGCKDRAIDRKVQEVLK